MTLDANGRTPAAVIFDFDGVVVDSEMLSARAWQRCLARYGGHMAVEQFDEFIGFNHNETVHHLIKLTGVDVEPSTLGNAAWDEQIRLFAEEGEAMPGFFPLVEALRGLDIPLGVASNSVSWYVRRVLKMIDADHYFGCVVCADDVPLPKPAPDVYETAARLLSAPPERCLALEDSPAGAQAAVAAGMHCIAIPNPALGMFHVEGVRAVYPSLTALHAELEAVLAASALSAGQS
jgi:HAD superfamily hydrolase (TIGR01509 family)